MKVIVLQPSYLESTVSAIKDLDVERDLRPFLPDGTDWVIETVFIHKRTSYAQIKKLQADVFINLCDGASDDDVAGPDVVLALERLGRPYTGCDSRFYSVTKDSMKLACQYSGVRLPKFATVDSLAELDTITNLSFPMFVKHRNGANSVGVTEKSKVENREQLAEQVSILLEVDGTALIEEFIDGREFAVLLSNNPEDPFSPYCYAPVEVNFGGEKVNYKTFEYKWMSKNHYSLVTDTKLANELIEMTKSVWVTLGGNGYARSDIRMDKDGKLYFLELNANPSIFYEQDNGGAADIALYLGDVSHKVFVERIIEDALVRRQRQIPCHVIKYDEKIGMGSYAARDIAKGEIVKFREQTPFYLVTGSHVKKHWPTLMQEYFLHNAYEICYDTYIVWDPDGTNDTMPVNHSCDPTLVIDGLNDIAARDIKEGEQLTFDYATFVTKKIVDFKCHCGAKECRGSWKPEDSLQDWYKAKYGENIHPAIKQFQLLHGVRAKL